MAFDVTPTSGAGPYVFTASFENASVINTSFFSMSFVSGLGTGSCPPPLTGGANNSIAVNALLESGVYTQPTATIPVGSCRTYTLFIRRLSDNAIVSTMSVNISNI